MSEPGGMPPVFPGLDRGLAALLEVRLADFEAALAREGLTRIPELPGHEEMARVFLSSEFIAGAVTRNPALLRNLAGSGGLSGSRDPGFWDTEADRLTADCGAGEVPGILRDFKVREIIRIGWRDLAGRAGLEETLADLSALAGACIRTGLDRLYRDKCRRLGTPRDSRGARQELIVLGMGKLGAGELNFSSDIDLIFVYPREGQTRLDDRTGMDNGEFFNRLCKQFVRMFSPGDGTHFYRVDTRLRPFGDGGPLVMSADSFEEYYQSHGRDWERYAMIKARPVAGDIRAGRDLLRRLNGFIYRRYFDYGSFDAFRDMKQRIALQVRNARLQNNIKLGPGGIREIEFFCQLFQLIRGGVEPSLQTPKLLEVLDLLVVHDCIDDATRTDLRQAYCFLRAVENRLQAAQDKQTHEIPEHPEHLKILAVSMGFETAAAFQSELERFLGRVHHHFSQLLVRDADATHDTVVRDVSGLWMNLSDPQGGNLSARFLEGYTDPDRVLSLLRSLATHPNTMRLTPAGRKKLSRLVPLLVKQAGQGPDAESVLVQLIDLIISIERRTTYLSLLAESPAARETLIGLARKSPWIITFLSRHPVLLDELMHPATLYSPPKKPALEKEMALRMARVPNQDLEYLLEELNIFRQINTLRVAAADISGDYPLMKVSDHLTYIAETILAQVLRIAWDTVTAKYGYPPGLSRAGMDACGFAIVAYGKVGGLEMGYKSDLDLVFLCKGEDAGLTAGTDRSLDILGFYAALSQRIIHALTLHTPAGTLYGADMRLRPGGASGMIVSHIDAFARYLDQEAWTWEHQALIRARPVAGDRTLQAQFNNIRHDILCRERAAETLKQEVREMRERMRTEHLTQVPGEFDLKQGRGGIVDIEFLVQYLVLRYGASHPDVTVWTDNIRLLEGLSCEGLISAKESGELQFAYVTLRRAIHRLTLQEKKPRVPESRFSDLTRTVWQMYSDQFQAITGE